LKVLHNYFSDLYPAKIFFQQNCSFHAVCVFRDTDKLLKLSKMLCKVKFHLQRREEECAATARSSSDWQTKSTRVLCFFIKRRQQGKL